MQLLKQSRGNVTPSAVRAWELFLLVASTMPPSKEFVGLVSEYVHTVSHTEHDADPKVKDLALRTWNALKRSAKAGARRTVSPCHADSSHPRLRPCKALVHAHCLAHYYISPYSVLPTVSSLEAYSVLPG